MRKTGKWIVAQLTMALALCVAVTASAETITCASCGKEIDASSAFCPYCGTKVEAGLQITNVIPLPTGQTYIAWTDGLNNGPYTVLFRYYVDDDYDSQAQRAQIFWRDGEDVTDCNWSINYLTPGEDYWMIVRDSDKNEARYLYRAPEAAVFTDLPIEVSATPLAGSLDENETLPCFIADDIAADIAAGEDSYALNLKLTIGDHDNDYPYAVTVVLRDPNGVPIVDHYKADNEFRYNTISTGWKFYSLGTYFEHVQGQYDQIPVGAYSVSVYINGQYVGESLFMVR